MEKKKLLCLRFCLYLLLIIGGIFNGYAANGKSQIAISSITTDKTNYAIGESIGFSFSITNVGDSNVDSFKVSYTINGHDTKEETFTITLLAGRNADSRASYIPTVTSQSLNALMSVTVTEVNGVVVDALSAPTISETISIYDYLFSRNVVIEEGTGTWCGWCVRGIVAMEKMKETHPDDFIGIAVHNNDAITVADYTKATDFTSYPACNLDRSSFRLSVDPTSFDTYYAFSKSLNTVGKISLTGTASDDNTTISITTHSVFSYTGDGAYSCALVLMEDGITGYIQNNEFAGGEYGEMGGFESLPSKVLTTYNDVARGIFPYYNGENIVNGVTKDKDYSYAYTITIPNTIQHKSKLSVVALLLDDATGQIVNAAKIAVPMPDDVVPDVVPDTPTTGTYQYVDMGLSVLWAKSNMLAGDEGFGEASSQECFGGYFGWADPTGLLTSSIAEDYPSAETLPLEISGTELDIAHMKWGDDWRLPTHNEFTELYDNCITSSETINDVPGTLFTSIKNGNTIFLPFNGSRYETDIYDAGSYGSYWSGTLCPDSFDGIFYAFEFDFDDYGVNVNNVANRFDGCGVRPVCANRSSNGAIKADEKLAKEIADVSFYMMNGILVKNPEPGIYIKMIRYTDGSIAYEKLLIK